MSLIDEIREQPETLARVVERGRDAVEAAAAEIRAADPEFVVIAARGTSDHAATYAQYVFGIRHGLATALASPSIVSLHRATLRLERALVIGVSQSGASPDVAAVVAAARERGALTIAITTDGGSALGRAATRVLELHAGIETAVAATKTYTAELTLIAMLSAALARSSHDWRSVGDLAAAAGRGLQEEDAAAKVAADQAGLPRAFVLGRSYSYATAREWALKLKELTYLPADPYSTADFMHGPLALLSPDDVVFAASTTGEGAGDVRQTVDRLVRDHGVRVLLLSDDAAARATATWALRAPSGLPEWLAPIPAIVPAQLHAYHLARARGLDPDAPRSISKVTLTR
ncbi:MAG: SIS domain-containing protein [Chloroflexi bacterium]|nr:SIS domain-containing protein [Chloroflexota bacterium]